MLYTTQFPHEVAEAARVPRDAITAALEAWRPRDADFGEPQLPNRWSCDDVALGPLLCDWQELPQLSDAGPAWGAMRGICTRARVGGEWCNPRCFQYTQRGAVWNVVQPRRDDAEVRASVLLPQWRTAACNLTRVEVRGNPPPAHAAVLGAFRGVELSARPNADIVLVPRTLPNAEGAIVLELPLQPLRPCDGRDARVLREFARHGNVARGLLDTLATYLPWERAVVEVALPAANDKWHEYEVVVDVWASTVVTTGVQPSSPRDASCPWQLQWTNV
jgi:hypothetical protein